MLRGTFGKRMTESPHAASAAPAGLGDDDEQRLIPAEVWNGPHGETLRRLGFHPDDPANFALTPERARAMDDAATARMNGLVAKVNAHIPGIAVVPWAMIPWSVWRGLNAELLIKTDFLPSSPWNNMLLPGDARTSEHLGLPEHPRAPVPGLDENLTDMIDELRAEQRAEIDACMMAISRGDWSALSRYEEVKNERFRKLFALARHVASMVFGPDVCARHDELFGIGLSEVTG